MPAKAKIMSILDRARIAMEESYGYEETGYEPPVERYVERSYPSHSSYPSSTYDEEYVRDEYYREPPPETYPGR